MLKELKKNGLSLSLLSELAYKSNLGRSLVHTLRKLEEIIRFYQEAEVLDNVDLDYRIKSKDSCLRKYDKFYPEMRLEKVFNDILGFRMLIDNYDLLLIDEIPETIRIVDMRKGKARDDGYCGIHLYYQPDHVHYPIEIQANTYYDRQMNNWLHKYLYKKDYTDFVGKTLRQQYECGKILDEQDFRKVLYHVLSDSKEI